MRGNTAQLARRVLRFIWIAMLFVLGTLALASLVLIPVSIVSPFSAGVSAWQMRSFPNEMQRGTFRTFPTGGPVYSGGAANLDSGSAGLLISITWRHDGEDVIRPAHDITFNRSIEPIDGYPAANDYNRWLHTLGPKWMRLSWTYWSGQNRDYYENSGYIALVAPLPVVALFFGLLPTIHLTRWWRRGSAGRGFPVIPPRPAVMEPEQKSK